MIEKTKKQTAPELQDYLGETVRYYRANESKGLIPNPAPSAMKEAEIA
jgi:hypothetical protein